MFKKICGITNVEDALHAVAAGATHIGLIFVPGTPRLVSLEKAAEISAAVDKKAIVVGVFQNQSEEEIAAAVAAADLQAIQLHGQEKPEFCQKLGEKHGLPVIKTIVLEDAPIFVQADPIRTLMKKAEPYTTAQVTYLLFDKAKNSKQNAQAWVTAAASQLWMAETLWREEKKAEKYELPPYFFAGGLTKDNLQLAYMMTKAIGFDVASGVEAATGKKDPAMVSAFIKKIVDLDEQGVDEIIRDDKEHAGQQEETRQ
ncbi:MAG: phosphoribosylanthranilate isomerase [Cyanobacteria bacterium REEB67]|nr:phosphoribosylanthranilate isomerase [Cyanobacteria bacterium REEB67]